MSVINDIVSLTADLISIPSVTSRHDEVDRCARFIQAWCERESITCTRMDNNGVPSLMVGPASRNAPLLLMTHFDVVDGPSHLFTPEVRDNVLHGRGAIDDKYAVALSLVLYRERLRTARACGLGQDDVPLQLLMTGDEEEGGKNGARFALDHVQAAFCVAIDGGSPGTIITKEKGVLDFTLTAHGKAAHGARPWLGVNAVDLLMADYAALKPLFPGQTRQDDPDHWHRSLNLGILNAGDAVNKVPDVATARLDVRYTEQDDPDALVKAMTEAVSGTLVLDRREPLFHTGNTPWLARLLACAPGSATGFAHGASDARFLSAHNIPGVVWGAEGETSQHTAHEHLLIPSLQPLYAALDALVADIPLPCPHGAPHPRS